MEEIYDVTALAREITDAGQTYFDIISEKTTYRLENFGNPNPQYNFIKFNGVALTADNTTTNITQIIPFSTIATYRQFLSTALENDTDYGALMYDATSNIHIGLFHNNSSENIQPTIPFDKGSQIVFQILINPSSDLIPIYEGSYTTFRPIPPECDLLIVASSSTSVDVLRLTNKGDSTNQPSGDQELQLIIDSQSHSNPPKANSTILKSMLNLTTLLSKTS